MPGEHQTGLGEGLAVGVVELVAVAVPLLDRPRRRTPPARRCPRRASAFCRPEAHGAAEVAGAVDELLLLLDRRDHRLDRVGVELGRPGLAEAGDVAGVLDDHALQAQAQAEGRDAVGAGVAQRAELALDAAHAEAARHQHGVDVGEVLGGAGLGLALVGGDPADVDLGLVGEAAGAQRLG